MIGFNIVSYGRMAFRFSIMGETEIVMEMHSNSVTGASGIVLSMKSSFKDRRQVKTVVLA